jgi:hypothetical protein
MTLVIIFGPPAVGKMAVGMELEHLTGFRLFHMTVDPVTLSACYVVRRIARA